MTLSQKKRIQLIVSGLVQGVFFRATACQAALDFNLTGTVKNLPDKNVEIIAEGTEEQLNKIIEWAKTGSPLSQVANLDITWLPYKKEFNDFKITH